MSSSTPRYQLTEVQATSLLVAYWRQIETDRMSYNQHGTPPSPPLIQDPFAKLLVQELGRSRHLEQWMKSPMLPFGIEVMALRTRVIDDWLVEQKPQLKKKQIVNLGAGMCTRPYRMKELSGGGTSVSFFEVESDIDLLTAKHGVLKEKGFTPVVANLQTVHADVTDTEALKEALLASGFDPNQPTDWILEGLMEYLPMATHSKIFACLRGLSKDAPGGSSRIMVWQNDPWCLDWCRMMDISLPHIGDRTKEDLWSILEANDWSENKVIIDNAYWWSHFQRCASSVPVYMIACELKLD